MKLGQAILVDSRSTEIKYQRGRRVLAGVNLMKNNLSRLVRSEEWKVVVREGEGSGLVVGEGKANSVGFGVICGLKAETSMVVVGLSVVGSTMLEDDGK